MPDAPALKSRTLPLFFLGAAALAGSWVWFWKSDVKPNSSKPLLVYCAASLKNPMEQIAAEYLRDTGARVELSLGGSQTLLANIGIARRGDLYLPADESYVAMAREKSLIAVAWPLATQTAVIVVAKGNPKGIHSLAAFQNSSLTLSQANPQTAAIGKLLREFIEPRLWESLSNRTIVFKPNVNDAANDVKLGAVDAAIVWDSMQSQYPDLEFIRAAELANVKARVTVSVLACSEQREAAEKFARYIGSPEHGLKHFERSGFDIGSVAR